MGRLIGRPILGLATGRRVFIAVRSSAKAGPLTHEFRYRSHLSSPVTFANAMSSDIPLRLLEFLVSPPGLLALFAVLLVFPLLVAPIYWRHSARKLALHFRARVSYPAANVFFEYRGRPVRLERRTASRYGSYVTLTIGTTLRQKLFIGNPESTIVRSIFWLHSPARTSLIDGRALLVDSTNESLRAKASQMLTALKPGDLFGSQYACLLVPAAHEYLSRTFPSGTTASFYGSVEGIYDEPTRLEFALDRICAILAWAETTVIEGH